MKESQATPTRANQAQLVFVEPHTYRRRRLMDAARMLPALGVVLWMIPLLWPSETSEMQQPVSMSSAILYIFAVWLGLIVAAAGIWLKTRSDVTDKSHDVASGEPRGSR